MPTQAIAPRKIERYGWVPDLPDDRDLLFVAPPDVIGDLPERVDLRSKCPPVYDQGQLGSCTANAIASAFQFDLMKQGLNSFIPSRLFIYYEERRYLNSLDSDSGAMIRDGIKVVHKLGAPPESDWGYDISKFTQAPPAQAYTDAGTNQVITYRRLSHDLKVLKACLAAGYPFVFGFTVYESFEGQAMASNGMMPMPAKGEQVVGGHAVMAVGYDDTKVNANTKVGGFWVKNSWGTAWGDSGYFFMPYAYMAKRGFTSDLWTIRTVE